ncbi:MAG: M1 family aminopeptidase, partial [Candidatus Sulfotelmatobacter sp.]
MTKVLANREARGIALAIIALILCATPSVGAAAVTQEAQPAKPAEALYLQLSQVTLDPARVYHVREATLDRSAIHITLEDGTIAFTQDVMGRVTGAFFEGDGEVLLEPPNEVERKSMSLFTGMAILEERFETAYFRFNDDVMAELRPGLRAPEDAQEFVSRWGDTARNLAQQDALRLLVSFSRLLPTASGKSGVVSTEAGQAGASNDRMLHARVQGTQLGVFDVYFDSMATESIQAGQARKAENGLTYYDVWTSFAPAAGAPLSGETELAQQANSGSAHEDPVAIRHFAITCKVTPPKQIHAEARLQIEVRHDGARTLLFELSRFLQVESVEMDGQPVEFLHNPAIEGTQLERRGNDLVAVILPEPARTGQKHELRFVYGGEVLAEAGSGLLYVGEHGTWYPNRGLVMADFDIEFHYPAAWTLVATGKLEPSSTTGGAAAAGTTTEGDAVAPGEQVSRWISERPIPVAGFNLGKYSVATVKAGTVTVDAYATPGVERNFPSAPVEVLPPNPPDEPLPQRTPLIITPANPSPARNAFSVAETAARAIRFYSDRFGPFPYSHLALTQMPGADSQGWPGLVFLSSYAFLDDEERKELRFSPFRTLMQEQITAHETAHQWWGDLVTWTTYRDQWISEGLANYSAFMMLQEKDPDGFREIMERYRRELVEKDKSGSVPKDAGPVTLGGRLESSRSPGGYDAISYGRSTWLFHMLRTMMQDGAALQSDGAGRNGSGKDEPFVRALRKVRDRYEGKSINTRELLAVFAEELPPGLRYEGKSSLDWFLEGWVNGTSLPKLELRAAKFLPKNGRTLVSGTILQKDAPADLVTSVPVYGSGPGKRPQLLGRVFADGQESSFHLSAPSGISKIVL